MAGLRPPGPLCLEGNVSRNWMEWIRAFEFYETATELSTKSDGVRYATFLHVAGPAAQQIATTFAFTSGEVGKVSSLKKKFETYCQPKRNIAVLRYIFNTRNQKNEETFNKYLTELKAHVKDCEFGDLEDDLLRDRIVCGIRDQTLREKLLQTEKLTLQKCIDVCTVTENSAIQMTQLSQNDKDKAKAVDRIDHVRRNRQSTPHRDRGPQRQKNPTADNRSNENSIKMTCPDCTYIHRGHFCPATTQECRACGKIGHFSNSARCQYRRQNDDQRRRQIYSGRQQHRNVREVEADDYASTYDEGETSEPPTTMSDDEQYVDQLYIDEVIIVDDLDLQRDNEWTQKCMINGLDVNFKLDSGAQVNILPEHVSRNANLSLEKSLVTLRSYSGHTMKPIGKTTCDVLVGKRKYSLTFEVVVGNVKPLLGMKACNDLNLLKRCESVSDVASETTHGLASKTAASARNHHPTPNPASTSPTPAANAHAPPRQDKKSSAPPRKTADPPAVYEDLFQGLGRLHNHEYSISLRTDVEPVKCPPRSVPHKLRDKIKAELDRMEGMGVIERVNGPTEWVSAMTVVHKPDGGVRICLDPRGLNKAIRREHYPMQTFEQISARMPNAKVFSKVDAKSGYWQLPLTEESSYYTTFNSEFGRYRYKVMPFGISSASEIWQRAMIDEFGQLEGVEIVADDILIWGENIAQHDARLFAFLDKVRLSGLKLNKAKSIIRSREIEYVGHVITSDGVKPSAERVKSITQIPYPTSKKEVETFLGMITYLGKFIPNLSEITAPLRELTQKGVVWHWEPEHAKAVDALKRTITSAPVLKLYDASKSVALATDASNEGFGAVLLQDNCPIAYASRRVNDAEHNYAPIEKEMCAILFACTKFHNYVYGQKVIVCTDHKPLIGIFAKPLHKLSPRLQRMRLHLMAYDIQPHWKPGKEMFVPDALSRLLPASSQRVPTEPYISVDIDTLECAMHMSARRLEQFRKETKQDPALRAVAAFIRNGWPENKDELPCEVTPYHSFRDELIEVDGLILKDCKLVVPRSLQCEMLEILHQSHLGIVKLKSRARQVFFWPGMNAQIEDKVARCSVCQTTRKAQQSEPLISHEIPERSWSKLGIDIFHLDGVNYLLVVDYYSKFPEVEILPQMTAYHVISALKHIFARNGIPDTIVSDNARQFACSEFHQFTQEWEINHHTSSPTYPQSNGQAERCVQTVKMLFKKAKLCKRDPEYALLEYRNTPLDGTCGYAPAQLLNGRLLRSRIPVSEKLLRPQNIPPIREHLIARQRNQREYFDRHARSTPLPALRTNQDVVFRAKDSTWRTGHVASAAETPRSYIIKTEQGEYRRNRKHIRPIPSSPSSPTPPNQQARAAMPRHQRQTQSQRYQNITLTHATTTRSGRVSKPPARLQL